MSLYGKYLIDPIIFYYHPIKNGVRIERKILEVLDDFIIRDQGGKKTKWVELDLSKIITIFNGVANIYDDYDENSAKRYPNINDSDEEEEDNDSDNENDSDKEDNRRVHRITHRRFNKRN